MISEPAEGSSDADGFPDIDRMCLLYFSPQNQLQKHQQLRKLLPPQKKLHPPSSLQVSLYNYTRFADPHEGPCRCGSNTVHYQLTWS